MKGDTVSTARASAPCDTLTSGQLADYAESAGLLIPKPRKPGLVRTSPEAGQNTEPKGQTMTVNAEKKLTKLQAAFAAEYILDFNGAQAAGRAGSKAKDLSVAGSEFLANPRVQAEVARLMAERSQRTKINADWVLTRLAAEAEADLADIYTANGALLPVSEWPEIWRKGLVQGVKHTEVKDSQGNLTGDTIVEIKLSDRIKRIELIGKHVDVQAFREQIQQDGTLTLTVSAEDAAL